MSVCAIVLWASRLWRAFRWCPCCHWHLWKRWGVSGRVIFGWKCWGHTRLVEVYTVYNVYICIHTEIWWKMKWRKNKSNSPYYSFIFCGLVDDCIWYIICTVFTFVKNTYTYKNTCIIQIYYIYMHTFWNILSSFFMPKECFAFEAGNFLISQPLQAPGPLKGSSQFPDVHEVRRGSPGHRWWGICSWLLI